MKAKIFILFILCLMVFSNIIQVQAQDTYTLDNTTLEINTIAEKLHVPWEIYWGPDNWIWMTERDGNISRLNPATGEMQLLHNLFDCFEHSESGLLALTLHPDFEKPTLCVFGL